MTQTITSQEQKLSFAELQSSLKLSILSHRYTKHIYDYQPFKFQLLHISELILSFSRDCAKLIYLDVYQQIILLAKAMEHIRGRSVQELQTVVRLCGNKDENIESILRNIQLSSDQYQFMYNVLLILYNKIDKLRNERDVLKREVLEKQVDRKELFQLSQLLKNKIEELTKDRKLGVQGEDQQIKGYECSFDGSTQKIFQTPPFKEVYNSAKFQQNKQNLIDQFRSVSAFECSGFGMQAQTLMKKYNLTPEEFKQVIKGYAQQQRKKGQKFLVDSQKKLYLQNTRIIKMDEQKQNSLKKASFQKVKISFIK